VDLKGLGLGGDIVEFSCDCVNDECCVVGMVGMLKAQGLGLLVGSGRETD